ncbi:hypothetical protein BJ546DRAFT_648885 [Cryomyces antarcticus]
MPVCQINYCKYGTGCCEANLLFSCFWSSFGITYILQCYSFAPLYVLVPMPIYRAYAFQARRPSELVQYVPLDTLQCLVRVAHVLHSAPHVERLNRLFEKFRCRSHRGQCRSICTMTRWMGAGKDIMSKEWDALSSTLDGWYEPKVPFDCGRRPTIRARFEAQLNGRDVEEEFEGIPAYLDTWSDE